MKLTDFSDSTEVQRFFAEALEKLSGVKITSVFSACPSFNNHRGFRSYASDTEIYILFENSDCLVIEYRFIDSLNIVLRKLSGEEKKLHDESLLKDCFNDSTDIYSYVSDNQQKLNSRQIISLEYDSLTGVKIEKVTKPYFKWIDGDIEEVMPLETTFGNIVFEMADGNSFVISPGDAEMDGYTLVWSENADETTEYVKGECL